MLLISPFKVIIKHRSILLATAWNDIRARYAGSLLGVMWLILYPLLLLTAYSFVYIFIFSARVGTFAGPEYVALIFSGLIPFLGFTEGLATTIPSVSMNAVYVKNTLFPIDILPVKSVITSQCTQIVGLSILMVAIIILGKFTPYAFLVVPIWFFQILLGIGLGWILSAINVFLRDLQNIVTLITIFFMMISPIAYTVDMVPVTIRPFLKINILYYYITAYQDSLIVGCFPRENVLIYLIIISSFIFIFGYWFFSKMKLIFVDSL